MGLMRGVGGGEAPVMVFLFFVFVVVNPHPGYFFIDF